MTNTTYDISEVDRIYQLQHTTSNLQAMKNTSLRERLERITRIENYLQDSRNLDQLAKAMWYDLRKSREEVISTELVPLFTIIAYIRKNLRSWIRPSRRSVPLPMLGVSAYVRYEPKGQVLLIAPWNYPFQLAMVPLVHAIAAGNVTIVKPSEVSAATSSYIKQMLNELFDEKEVAVIEGDVPVTTALLEKPFHHIFFTGSPAVGKIVMKAASKHLTSVTLELGGKSPCVIDDTVNIKKVAEQLAWGKLLNNGQTCIAPDYILIHRSKKIEFAEAYARKVNAFYNSDGQGIQASPYYTRIINEKNFIRLKKLYDDALAKGAEVLLGGEMDEEDKFMAPILLDKVTADMSVMQEEVFGPILPLVEFDNIEEVPDQINRLPKPLAMYIMSKNRANTRYLLNHSTAGGTAINEVMITSVNPDVPFGGVNNSGIGKSNGWHSFVEFSNERGVQKRHFMDFKLIFPPYKSKIFNLLMKLSRW